MMGFYFTFKKNLFAR